MKNRYTSERTGKKRPLSLLFLWLIAITPLCIAGAERYCDEVFPEILVTSNCVYTRTDASQQLVLDLYEPAGDRDSTRPLIVWMHGGGFFQGDKNDGPMVNLCTVFARRGYVCVSPDYRLLLKSRNDWTNTVLLRAADVNNIVHRSRKKDMPRKISLARKYHPLMAYLDANPSITNSLHDLAGVMRLTPAYLSTSFRYDIGTPLKRIIIERVMCRAEREIVSTDKKIRTIARDLGFSDELYFSKFFKRESGMSPKDYRRLHVE